MGVAPDAPMLDIAYKLVAYDGRGRIKLSTGKSLLPGRKQVFRVEQDGVAAYDVIARDGEHLPGRPLLRKMMEKGWRLPDAHVTLDDARRFREAELRRLPAEVRAIAPADPPYTIHVSAELAAETSRLREQYLPALH